MAIQRWLRLQYLKLVRIDDTPGKVATGVAVGVFLGLFPTFGVGTILAFALAVLFHFNRAAAILGTFIMNPLTTPLFWSASALLGALLVGGDWRAAVRAVEEFSRGFAFRLLLSWEGWRAILGAAGRGLSVYLVGNLLLSLLLASIAYPSTLKVVQAHRRRKAARRARGGLERTGSHG